MSLSARDAAHTAAHLGLTSIAAANLAARVTAVEGASFDVSNKVSKGDLMLNVKDYGALGDGSTNDTTAINTALAALSAAGGGTLLFPSGVYMTNGGHSLPAYSHIRGSEQTSRYWGYNPEVPPPTACALKLRTGTSATAMFLSSSSYTAGSVSDLSLLGNNVGSGIHGWTFANPAGIINNVTVSNVAIIGFTGDGIRGRLFASRFHHLFIGGCQGWGLHCPDLTQWTDVWFHGAIVTECKLGCVNIDSSWSSGEVHFNMCRLERSGWDNTNITVPLAVGSPGIRLRGNLLNASFIGCSTDANSGHGIVIGGATDRSVHHIQLIGCRFNRDGFGDMVALGEYAAIKVAGTVESQVDRVSILGCTTTEGLADDNGAHPAALHPKYGLWLERTTFLGISGGSVADSHNTALTGGAGGIDTNYRAIISMRLGGKSWQVLAHGDTAERPAAMKGGFFVNVETGAVQACLDGSTWTTV